MDVPTGAEEAAVDSGFPGWSADFVLSFTGGYVGESAAGDVEPSHCCGFVVACVRGDPFVDLEG